MLEFINSNGVLFSGIFAIIAALISVLVTVIRDHKQSRIETINSLRKELKKAQQELCELKSKLEISNSIEHAEKNIDKTHGSIYYEKLITGGKRAICGFCWEKEHIKIPIVPDLVFDEYTRQRYYSGYCNSCKAHCIENIIPKYMEIPDIAEDDELPFI